MTIASGLGLLASIAGISCGTYLSLAKSECAKRKYPRLRSSAISLADAFRKDTVQALIKLSLCLRAAVLILCVMLALTAHLTFEKSLIFFTSNGRLGGANLGKIAMEPDRKSWPTFNEVAKTDDLTGIEMYQYALLPSLRPKEIVAVDMEVASASWSSSGQYVDLFGMFVGEDDLRMFADTFLLYSDQEYSDFPSANDTSYYHDFYHDLEGGQTANRFGGVDRIQPSACENGWLPRRTARLHRSNRGVLGILGCDYGNTTHNFCGSYSEFTQKWFFHCDSYLEDYDLCPNSMGEPCTRALYFNGGICRLGNGDQKFQECPRNFKSIDHDEFPPPEPMTSSPGSDRPNWIADGDIFVAASPKPLPGTYSMSLWLLPFNYLFVVISKAIQVRQISKGRYGTFEEVVQQLNHASCGMKTYPAFKMMFALIIFPLYGDTILPIIVLAPVNRIKKVGDYVVGTDLGLSALATATLPAVILAIIESLTLMTQQSPSSEKCSLKKCCMMVWRECVFWLCILAGLGSLFYASYVLARIAGNTEFVFPSIHIVLEIDFSLSFSFLCDVTQLASLLILLNDVLSKLAKVINMIKRLKPKEEDTGNANAPIKDTIIGREGHATQAPRGV